MLRQGDGQYPNGRVSAIAAQEVVAPSPCWLPPSRESDIGSGADGGTLRRPRPVPFVNSATHRLRIMGKSMGAIPGHPLRPEKAKTGDETLSGALVEPVS